MADRLTGRELLAIGARVARAHDGNHQSLRQTEADREALWRELYVLRNLRSVRDTPASAPESPATAPTPPHPTHEPHHTHGDPQHDRQ